jgi:hypothetical protein
MFHLLGGAVSTLKARQESYIGYYLSYCIRLRVSQCIIIHIHKKPEYRYPLWGELVSRLYDIHKISAGFSWEG